MDRVWCVLRLSLVWVLGLQLKFKITESTCPYDFPSQRMKHALVQVLLLPYSCLRERDPIRMQRNDIVIVLKLHHVEHLLKV